MRRAAVLFFLLLTGCSTAPLAGFLDAVRPGKIDPGKPFYGGVGADPVTGAPPVTVVPPAAPVPPPGPVVR
jgi:hypothetical protein